MSTIELERTETVVSPADVLNRAADLIEEKGLAKRVFAAADGSHCAWGAMLEAGYALGELSLEAAETLMLAVVPRGESIPFWNDRPERTQAQVVAKLREAADRA